jgi:hypothetical protein
MRGGKYVRKWRTANHESAFPVINDVREVRAAARDHLASERTGKPADARCQVCGERLEVEPRRRRHC